MNISRRQLKQLIESIPNDFKAKIHKYNVYKRGRIKTQFALIGDFDWDILEQAYKESGLLKKYYLKHRAKIGNEFIYY